jgi:hypothetical protein
MYLRLKKMVRDLTSLNKLCYSGAILLIACTLRPADAQAAQSWYVNPYSTLPATLQNGTSPPTGFSAVDQRVWSRIQPGDTLRLMPGIYGPINVERSGTAAAPITITTGGSVASGRVIIHGANAPLNSNGINFGARQYVNVFGPSWKSIVITGFSTGHGIKIGVQSSFIKLKNLEIHGNGRLYAGVNQGGGVYSAGSGGEIQRKRRFGGFTSSHLFPQVDAFPVPCHNAKSS